MNPFMYYKNPTSKKECQSNLNYWWYESVMSDEDMEAKGYLPVQFRTFIKEMVREEKRIMSNLGSNYEAS